MFSSNKKKRGLDKDDDDIDAISPMTRSTQRSVGSASQQQQQRSVKKIAKHRSAEDGGAGSVIATGLAFQELMVSHLSYHRERLMLLAHRQSQEWNLDAGIDDSTDEESLIRRDQVVDSVSEWRRVEKDLTARYEVRKGGDLFTFGSNDFNQCGLPAEASRDDKQDTIFPIRVAALPCSVRHVSAGGLGTLCATTDGRVFSWGASDEGNLGRTTETDVDQATPKVVEGFIVTTANNSYKKGNRSRDDGFIRTVAAGANHGLAVSAYGNVFMWGMYKDGDSGKFSDVEDGGTGAGSPLGCNEFPVQVHFPNAPTGAKVVDVFTGCDASYNAVLFDTGDLQTWGMGDVGQLARSRDMTDPDPSTGQFDLGKAFTGEEYQVTTKDPKTNKIITSTEFRFKPHVIAEKFLTPNFVRYQGCENLLLQPKKTVLSVACGLAHMIVVARDKGSADSRVYVSGMNNYGQLGNGNAATTKEIAEGKQGINRVDELTPVVSLDDADIIRVAAGEFHCLALDLQGRHVYAWGRSDSGQLGLGTEAQTKESGFIDVPTLVKFPAVSIDTNDDDDKDLERVTIIDSIACGGTHCLAVSIDEEVWVWGSNYSGATGYKTSNDKDLVVPKKLSDLLSNKYGVKGNVIQAVGGTTHSMVLLQPTL